MQKVCEGLRTEAEEQTALQQQLEQQQSQLAAADQQHSEALAQLASLRLTALDGTADKLLQQVHQACLLKITVLFNDCLLACMNIWLQDGPPSYSEFFG